MRGQADRKINKIAQLLNDLSSSARLAVSRLSSAEGFVPVCLQLPCKVMPYVETRECSGCVCGSSEAFVNELGAILLLLFFITLHGFYQLEYSTLHTTRLRKCCRYCANGPTGGAQGSTRDHHSIYPSKAKCGASKRSIIHGKSCNSQAVQYDVRTPLETPQTRHAILDAGGH